jgi:hypothetical protein
MTKATLKSPHGPGTISHAAMESLARELSVPLHLVEQACRRETAAIERDARIKHFVPVLVASRVRSELRRRQRGA